MPPSPPPPPPPPVRYAPPVREHVPLHSKSLCKNMARASGGANNMRPLSGGGGTNEKDPKKLMVHGLSIAEYFKLLIINRG